jgi:hypothetical protein
MPEIYSSNVRDFGPHRLSEAARLLDALAEHGWPKRFGEPWHAEIAVDAPIWEEGTVFITSDGTKSIVLRDGKPDLLLRCEFCDREVRIAELHTVQVWEVCPDCVPEAQTAERG